MDYFFQLVMSYLDNYSKRFVVCIQWI